MKRRSTKKSSAMAMATPIRSPSESPPKFKFNFSCFKTASTSSASPKKKNTTTTAKSSSAADPPIISPPPAALSSLSKAAPSTVADLREMTSFNIDSIKRHLDFSHSEILKDVEASHSRLHKRFKLEKEFKKMNDRIRETHDAMQASYMELIAESQASTNRVCKTTIPELLQSVDRAVDALRNRYGIASTTS
ncbi:hypothetical protein OSB04_022085 [Centaurea solstitialis]|uniref:Uncharacterized protein n=1 Tax=Centaurea solstitialis TaxID=347529 RepID=A0AA38W7B5_9ASTR|nr:hypothetical protein OSB04_022085 [Centaurea solstitialis]